MMILTKTDYDNWLLEAKYDTSCLEGKLVPIKLLIYRDTLNWKIVEDLEDLRNSLEASDIIWSSLLARLHRIVTTVPKTEISKSLGLSESKLKDGVLILLKLRKLLWQALVLEQWLRLILLSSSSTIGEWKDSSLSDLYNAAGVPKLFTSTDPQALERHAELTKKAKRFAVEVFPGFTTHRFAGLMDFARDLRELLSTSSKVELTLLSSYDSLTAILCKYQSKEALSSGTLESCGSPPTSPLTTGTDILENTSELCFDV